MSTIQTDNNGFPYFNDQGRIADMPEYSRILADHVASMGGLGPGGSSGTPADNMNNGWYEEWLGGDFYRWTQVYPISIPTLAQSWGSLSISSSIALPQKPTDATVIGIAASVSLLSGTSQGWAICSNPVWTVIIVSPNAIPAPSSWSICLVAYGTKNGVKK